MLFLGREERTEAEDTSFEALMTLSDGELEGTLGTGGILSELCCE